jgi:hypothetical protein
LSNHCLKPLGDLVFGDGHRRRGADLPPIGIEQCIDRRRFWQVVLGNCCPKFRPAEQKKTG